MKTSQRRMVGAAVVVIGSLLLGAWIVMACAAPPQPSPVPSPGAVSVLDRMVRIQHISQLPGPMDRMLIHGPLIVEPQCTSALQFDQDDQGEVAHFTIVQPGQLLYFVNVSDDDIELEIDNEAFVGKTTPLVLPGDSTTEVTVNPAANDGTTYAIMPADPSGEHGSPMLIVRKTPISSDGP